MANAVRMQSLVHAEWERIDFPGAYNWHDKIVVALLPLWPSCNASDVHYYIVIVIIIIRFGERFLIGHISRIFEV